MLEEPSFYNNFSNTESLYCDVGSIKILNDDNFKDFEDGFFAYKVYLFPPSDSISSLKDLKKLTHIVENTKIPVFIDPTLPETKYLSLSSSTPSNNVEVSNKQKNFNIFGAAYGEILELEDDNQDELKKISSLTDIQDELFEGDKIEIKNFEKTKGGDEIINNSGFCAQRESSPGKTKKKYQIEQHTSTIFDNVNQRIKESKAIFEVLAAAEEKSYSFSGFTSFFKTETEVFEEKVEETQEYRRRRFRKPRKISTLIEENDNNYEYTFFLANRPEY